MKNVVASTALSFDVYREAIDAASLHGITLSSFISMAIGHLLRMKPEEQAVICAGAGRKAKRVVAEADNEQ
ncbi:MAG: hypothetical protein J6I40_00525 [Mailhella sp.]|nr:hypothetical protein [Mailhella sp.]